MSPAKWPKTLPTLTPEQQQIRDDFMHYWHEVLPSQYGVADRFGHSYTVKHAPKQFLKTLEIGAGRGEHLLYERLTPEQCANYFCLELRPGLCQVIRDRFPDVKVVQADCQKRIDFPDGHFDRIVAIHVLEHLPNLPATVAEAYRLCDKTSGVFSVIIPCEGSWAYRLSRMISAERIFKQRYRQSYDWLVKSEHVNFPREIMQELDHYFVREHWRFWPIPAPAIFCNLFIGMTFRPRGRPLCNASS